MASILIMLASYDVGEYQYVTLLYQCTGYINHVQPSKHSTVVEAIYQIIKLYNVVNAIFRPYAYRTCDPDLIFF